MSKERPKNGSGLDQRERVAELVTRAEKLRARDEAHAKQVRQLAREMADSATIAVKREEDAALNGDPEAIYRHHRAARGRYVARRIDSYDDE